MQFVEGVAHAMDDYGRDKLFQYRHDVFITHLGWELNSQDGREMDEFDHEETVYVYANNDAGDIVGCARLLPTTAPYLLEEVFPELMNGADIPKSQDVWELSRFTSFDCQGNENNLDGQFSKEVSIQLLERSIQCAKRHGAKRIISVSPLGVERLIRAAGFKAHRAGPPMIVNNYPLFACWIEIE